MTKKDNKLPIRHEKKDAWGCSDASRQYLDQASHQTHHTLTEDPGPFKKLALSGDGNTLAAAAGGVLCLFNTRTRARLGRFVFDCNIVHITISFDGQVIFVADETNSIHVVDLPFSHQELVKETPISISAMALDGDASYLAFADIYGRTTVLNTSDFTRVAALDCRFTPHRMAFGSDPDLLLGFGEREIVVLQVSSRKCLARLGERHFVDDSFRVPGEYITTRASGGFEVFDSETGQCRSIVTLRNEPYDTTPDGTTLVIAGSYELRLCDTSQCEDIRQIHSYVREVGDVKICAEGQSIYVCGDDATIDSFSVTGERQATYSDFRNPIMAAAICDNDKALVVADEAGSVSRYDLVTGTIRRFHQHTCCISKLYIDGDLAATGAHDGWARVVNMNTGEEVFSTSYHGAPVQAVTLDGTRFVIIGNRFGQVQRFDLTEKKLVCEYHGNNSSIRCLSVSPCRRFLMSTNERGEVMVYDYVSGDLINQLNGFGIIYSGCFDESGEFLYFGDAIGRIAKARPTSPDIVDSWKSHKTDVRSINIRGHKLTSIGISDGVRVLDLDKGKTLLKCPVDTMPYRRVAIMNWGGTRLVTGGQDGCLMFRDTSDGAIQAELHNLAHGFLWLTRDENDAAKYGKCFWTDQESLIQVYNRSAGIDTLVLPTTEEHREYIQIHNNQSATMSRVGMTPEACERYAGERSATKPRSIMDYIPNTLLEQIPEPID